MGSRFTYRAPSFRAWVNKLKRGRRYLFGIPVGVPTEPDIVGASIRRLNDDELLSLTLVSSEAVSAKLRAPEVVSISDLTSASVVSIRRLDDSPRVSLRLKSA